MELLSKKEVCLIYTMGKVGSSSLEASLPGALHLHSLYGNPPNPLHWSMRNTAPFNSVKARVREVLKREVLKTRKVVNIISIVREPLPRNISMYFQALPFWLAQAQSGRGGKPLVDPRAEGIEVLIEGFDKSFNHNYPLTWFDKEIKLFSGIDVYSHEFDRSRGYMQVERGRFRLFVADMKNLNTLGYELGEFLGRPVVIETRNSGEKKWYSEPYQEFKDSYSAPADLLKMLELSQYFRHFFGG